MKKIASLCLTVALILTLLCSCESFVYPDGEKYSSGGTEISEKIESIEIDWLTDKVSIVPTDGDKIKFEETNGESFEEKLKLRYMADGTTLKIKFAASGFLSNFNLKKKELTVYVPESITLKNIKIRTSSADVFVGRISAKELDISSSSGALLAEKPTSENVNLDTSSGSITAKLGRVKKVRADSSSGDIELDILSADTVNLATSSGSINANLTTAKKLDASSSSGKIAVSTANGFENWELDTSSGDVSVTLNENYGFTAKVDTSSGEFESEIALAKKGNTYTCGDGSAKLSIDTSSGNISINRK